MAERKTVADEIREVLEPPPGDPDPATISDKEHLAQFLSLARILLNHGEDIAKALDDWGVDVGDESREPIHNLLVRESLARRLGYEVTDG